MIKAVILDFDGTLVTKDILDVVCGIVGKEEESMKINEEFHKGLRTGLAPLVERINFLKGVTLQQIESKLQQDSYLMSGAKELLEYLHKNKIVTILSSGNILPVLRYYQKLLNIDYIVGSQPEMNGDSIEGITEEAFSNKDFKITEVKRILENLHINSEETIAIGDSPADRKMFEYAKISIAINPKEGIERETDYLIHNLTEAIDICAKY